MLNDVFDLSLQELFLNLPTRIRQSGPVKGGINFAVKVRLDYLDFS